MLSKYFLFTFAIYEHHIPIFFPTDSNRFSLHWNDYKRNKNTYTQRTTNIWEHRAFENSL